MKREYSDYLLDIIESIEKMEKFTANATLESFEKDEKTFFAVIRALEIIGEAVNKIPAIIKHKYPAVPWKEMSTMRNKLIHEYFGVNSKVIWRTVKEDIPLVKPAIEIIYRSTK